MLPSELSHSKTYSASGVNKGPTNNTPSVSGSMPRGSDSRETARKHIEDIRRRNNTTGDGTLEFLSEQLNSEPSHFILELLQNADDTEYVAEPTVNIRFSDSRLLFECNEVGFTEADVEALCDTNKSTKTKKHPSRRQIGEKGIGFKSVFKVCSTVWIKSGGYQFKFDKNLPSGRVRPIWDPFPVEMTEGYTGILIHLDYEHKKGIRDALKALDPIILLFLQQIRTVNISIHADGIIARARRPSSSKLTAESIPKTPGVLNRIRCERNSSGSSMMVFRHPVTNLPYHKLRPNHRDAEIILAFPEEFETSQKYDLGGVYAYLPVGKYGIQFYVQSDFIATASREKIDKNAWNLHLIRELSVALVEAIKQFKDGSDSPLRYSWPWLVRFEIAELDIFRSLPGELEAKLSDTAILEDVQGNLMRPSNLMRVPKQFTDNNGTPLIPPEYCTRHPLHIKYLVGSGGNLEFFQRIGVKMQTASEFLDDLRRFMTKASDRFRKMPISWYAQLCNILMTLLKDHREEIVALEIVPLSSDDWIAPSAGYCYFPVEPQDELKFPSSVPNVFIVHPEVMKNQSHAELLRAIGIKNGTPTDLCKHIVDEHAEYSWKYTWSDPHQMLEKLKTLYRPEDLRSHVEFLYRSGWTPEKTKHHEAPDLWWTDENGEFGRTSDMYMRSSEPHSASFISDGCQSSLHFLHPSYMEAFSDEPDWMEFLIKTAKVRKMLRIATSSDGINYTLHDDFKRLAEENPLRILQMLRETWSFHGPWFTGFRGNVHGDAPSTLGESSKQELSRAVREITVPCHSGKWPIEIKLAEAYLPRKRLLELCDANMFERCGRTVENCVVCRTLGPLQSKQHAEKSRGAVPVNKLLDVSDAEEPSWDFLDHFGVILELTASVFIKHLRQIRGTNVSHEHMKQIYTHLEQFVDGPDGKDILKAFGNNASIYVPESIGASRGSWYTISSSVWDGPSCFKRVPRLESFYPHRKYLFVTKLGLTKANAEHLKLEAEQLRESDDIEHISSILAHISSLATFAKTPFKSIRMIPVRLKSPKSETFVLRSSDDKTWFVPDRHHLRKAFFGLVELAELSLLNSVQLKGLIEGLDLEERCLSKVTVQTGFKAEHPKPLEKYTAALRKKVPYIQSAILSHYVIQDSAEIISSFENIRAVRCERIGNSWKLKFANRVVDSHPDETDVSCRVEEEALVIYIAWENISEEDLLHEPPPLEMSNRLLEFCGIEDIEDATRLTQILAYSNLSRLENDMKAWPSRRKQTKVRKKAPEPVRSESEDTRQEQVEQGNGRDSIPTDMRTTEKSASSRNLGADQRTSGEAAAATPWQNTTRETIQGADTVSQTSEKNQSTPQAQGTPGLQRNDGDTSGKGEFPARDTSVQMLENNADHSRKEKEFGIADDMTHTIDEVTDSHEVDSVDRSVLELVQKANQELGGVLSDKGISQMFSRQGGDMKKRLAEIKERYKEPDHSGGFDVDWTSEGVDNDTPSPKQRNKKHFSSQRRGRKHLSPKHPKRTVASINSREHSSDERTPSQQRADFVPSRDYDEIASSNGRYRRGVERFHMRSGRVSLIDSSPRMVFYGEDTKDTQYLAELYMSRYFEKFLGKKEDGKHIYSPNMHWTSELRLRNGHAPFSPESGSKDFVHSAFTIINIEGNFMKLMGEKYAADGVPLAETCTFHIEVCATSSGLHSTFRLPGQQYEKARTMTAVNAQSPIEHVYIIARVYNIHADPGFALYADPWKLYLERIISLETDSSFEGRVTTTESAILFQDSIGKGLAEDIRQIYNGLYVSDQEIRLLQLKPGGNDEPLQGELIVKDLRDPTTSFWAISYVWGSRPNDQSPLFKTSQGEIRITDSLNECLRYLRKERVDALLWADAVCIDQSNNIEKNMQVRRMGSLYDSAEKVVIWTGGERKEDCYAMDWLRKLRGLPYNASDSDLDPATKIDRIAGFLTRAWFRRTWTVQELVFGSDVAIICGDQEIGWDHFIAVIIQCEKELSERSQALESSGPVLHLNRTRSLYKIEGRRYTLLELLEMFHYTESSKARDKLFAILHMATDAMDVKAFYPDYESTDEAILARYAKQYVASHEWLQLLYRAGSGKSSDFCTWIPDLMNSRPLRPKTYMPTISSWVISDPGDGTHSFSAGPPGSRGVVVHDPSPTYAAPVLALKGYILVSIGDCLDLDASSHFLGFSNVLESLKRMTTWGGYKDVSPDWKDDLLVKCLIGDSMGPYQKNQRLSELEAWPTDLVSTICRIQLDQDAAQQMNGMSGKSHALVNAYLQTAGKFLGLIPNAKVCVTAAKGYVGIVPGATQPNDQVVLLFGSKVPFVIREDRSAGRYKLIGECYLHGIMHFKDSILSGLVEREICLS